jgi:nucleotide-binding universal stress UspA family protein
MFHHLLVPLDGSPQSNVAIPIARVLAVDLNASIVLLRVLPWVGMAEDHEASAGAVDAMRRTVDDLSSGGIRVETVVRYGKPAEEIISECLTRKSDLIVMRTRGRAGLERAVLGSVTQRVLQASPVPVLVVRAGGRQPEHIHSVLVPVDGSAGASVALGTALRVARSTGAQVQLVEVVVPISTEAYAGAAFGAAPYVDPSWVDEALSEARSYVDGLVASLQDAGVTALGEVLVLGDVAPAIVEYEESVAADLIVMSTQARTGAARALLGSVADAVVRHADCPVMLLNQSQAESYSPSP